MAMRCCGLITPEKQAVPLQSVDVQVEVKDHVATVVSTLLYKNQEEKPIEAVFVFPMPSEAAVCHFSAKVGDTLIVAEVKEKKQAREEYDDALSSGQQAFLLEESDQSPDIFSMSVGSLSPGESASIRLEYVTELDVQADEALRFSLPAVLNPRYQPAGTESSSVNITSVPSSLVPYDLTFLTRVESQRPVSKMESNCPMEPVEYLSQDQTKALVKLAAGNKFDRDVELLIYYKESHQPSAVVEKGQTSAKPGSLMGDPALMLSLYPDFPKDIMSSVSSSGEFVFLLDRSGSMDCSMGHSRDSGTRITSARDTLLLLLKSLPMGCYFNIYSFGSTFEQIFQKSVEYDQKTMEEALKKVEMMEANLGGTEILSPLKHIYSQDCIPNQPRQLFVFTDGEVGNTKDVLKLVKSNAASHRCFSFGIGEGASSALIKGLAEEGRGHAQFIIGNDRMQPKVIQSLRFAMQPAVVDIAVKWDLPRGMSASVLSPPLTSIFQGQRSLLYAQLTGQSKEEADGCVTIKYSLAGRPTENKLNFSLKPAEDTGLTVHRLAARSLIRSLEQEATTGQEHDAVKKKIIDLSVQSGVSSSMTAFIAVNKTSGEAVQGPLLRRNVPTPTACARKAPPMSVMCGIVAPRSLKKMRRSPRSLRCAPAMCDMAVDLDSMGPQSLSHNMERFKAVLPPEPKVHRDPLLQVVSLQKASGCWELDPALAQALSKTSQDLESRLPGAAKREVWATVLALVWLHGVRADAQDEWELLVIKAVAWLRSQKALGLPECVDAANALLGCTVHKDTLGL
ncbi:von Willebrand factor A domain-containing protein 5A-like isoform X1 [Periophthalmus magnuspinnatus]|uniref:von Willebrand factor A domain-containing protein 5A-like isoform X1 n=1 Tax=Periophthalmus magnuspinnatus TaxID=409849 RepID=UPI00145B5DA1|nr:von Willebrand factor A domain-containing protein 5A-like isoform X1 [Periophthalmus magnuspinnatus]